MRDHERLGALVLLIALTAVGGCEDEDPNVLTSRADDARRDEGNAHEATGGTDDETRRQEEATIGTPEEVARLHGAQKIAYAALGKMLADFGVVLTPRAGSGALSAAELYTSGAQALGAPIYASRIPEMTAPSTSALAKEFDIFLAAAPEIVANIGQSKRCPGVVLVEKEQLTADGIACLLGKPATPEHVLLANKMVAEAADRTQGTSIAVATLLAAAHISE